MAEENNQIQTVEAERVPEKSGEMRMQARSLQVRSKLGQKLYELLENDVPLFYKKIRDISVSDIEEIADLPRDKRGNIARSALSYIVTHRRMYLDLIKIANADVEVDSKDMTADVKVFLEQLRKADTSDLETLVSEAEKIGAYDDGEDAE